MTARPKAAVSAGVSAPWEVAATRVASDVWVDWNGAARVAARTLGWDAGRNCELLFFSTLEIVGRPSTSATVTSAQATTISQRNRTVNRPKAVKKRRSSSKGPPYVRVGPPVRG